MALSSGLRYAPGERIADRFEIHQALRGGFCEVYLCLDLEYGHRPYALKTPAGEFVTDLGVLAAFESEAERWVRLHQHPNIVACHLLWRFENLPFLMLDWIKGHTADPSLRPYLLAGAPPADLAIRVGVGVARALDHAQRQIPGLVHGDIKPENVLLSTGDVPYLTDFGNSRLLSDRVAAGETPAEQVVFRRTESKGTRHYAAPELMAGGPADFRSDVFSLGRLVLEIECRTARPDDPGLGRIDDADALPSIADRELRQVLTKCLAAHPQQRYASFTALVGDLEAVAARRFGHRFEHITPVGNEQQAEPWTNRGIVFVEVGRNGAALQAFNEALRIAPTAAAYVNRSMVFSKLRRAPQALDDAKQALALDSRLSQAWIAKGLALEAAGNMGDAIAAYGEAITLEPTAAAPYANRGRLLLASRDLSGALRDMDAAVEREPTKDNYFNRGMAHAFRNELELAVQDFDEATSRDPLFAPAYQMKGKALGLQADYRGSIEPLTLAAELEPQNAETLYLLGLSFLNVGSIGIAKSSLECAEALGHPEARALRARVDQLLPRLPREATADILSIVDRLMAAASRRDIAGVMQAESAFDWRRFVAAADTVAVMLPQRKADHFKTRVEWVRRELEEQR